MVKVKTTILLTAPSNHRIQIPPNSESTKESMIEFLGKVNYDYAVKKGWIREKKEK